MTATPVGHHIDLQRVELPIAARSDRTAEGSPAAHLADLQGVSKVIVNPLTERALVLFDPGAIGIDGILRAFQPQAVDASRSVVRWHFPIAGLACARCARRVEEAVGQLPGVKATIVNRSAETLTVEFIVGWADLDAVRATLSAQGFDPGPHPGPASATAEGAHGHDS